ncbi:tRNA dihydrouridine(20/20a) synthase DusA [Clostridium sp. DJ247]|uniref:tRNA dihydrouridine(20/20a) synthase DusA n=1 Tax=Clostridium sp. DJ247 TaxID=2726188 RepID=UPI001628D960|nr:tRNA dihydrouridine(20/20a) synthase DusA [Clostridium sp. DJ247]MBC2581934.1 tRNA dihydrouridine(20/20a) synthase DusA [Clostridium sp. DJ247]
MDASKQTHTSKVSIAPMVDRTDRHFRYFCRIITKESLLYSEMITTYAILNGDRKKLLDFNPYEKPVALQIAGCNPNEVYEAVKIAEDWDYDEINLNVGCPSDRVSGNEMGAVLMAYPEVVAEMVGAMKKATKKPVTVKNRIGIEGKNVLPSSFSRTLLDKYEDMENFIKIVSKAGVDTFVIHARIAILEGLSPKENREIPPLRYEEVYKLKKEFPNLNIIINGGIKTEEDIEKHLEHVNGVMIGRAAYENPFFLTKVDKYFLNKTENRITRREIIERFIPYVEEEEKKGTPTNALLRHILGLFYEKRGSKVWKQFITPPYKKGKSGIQILNEVLEVLPQEVLDEKP